ncbi:hypothetical protein KP509_26G039800 [Ceratopteris richardii]|uniref:CCHC-type domain-containing protein n=1 Tax=Ceratopteris richardii TaxID=49495 RepID=A0A8T2RK60_CERRI|nr:hypothetical protein KP509_26G039800 [Ceratopteris richardii]
MVEIDTARLIKTDLMIKDNDGRTLHVQKVIYRNLPNACFNCYKQGHLIKDCPLLNKKSNPSQERSESTQDKINQGKSDSSN